MQHDYWRNKWEIGDIQFHLSEVYPLLTKYFSLKSKGKVLVPLCGKTKDMLWLLSEGYHVVGVELSPLACKAFFTENNLSFNIEERGLFTIYQSKNIEIWCGEFLQLPKEAYADLIAIYDHAALFALPEEMRLAYVSYIKQIAKSFSDIDMLLITVEYEEVLVKGPPFSITEEMVQALYADTFSIKRLPDDNISAFQSNAKFQNVAIKDYAYWLSYTK